MINISVLLSMRVRWIPIYLWIWQQSTRAQEALCCTARKSDSPRTITITATTLLYVHTCVWYCIHCFAYYYRLFLLLGAASRRMYVSFEKDCIERVLIADLVLLLVHISATPLTDHRHAHRSTPTTVTPRTAGNTAIPQGILVLSRSVSYSARTLLSLGRHPSTGTSRRMRRLS